MSTYKGFACQDTLKYRDTYPLHKYVSQQTGLRIAVAELDVPMVNSFITIATEAQDHDGCPHVLEHLIFLGSEDYPFKGILDSLANRSYAQGTNAWTDVDHTCYTLTTAGNEGFLRMLPVYLDHIFYPTLTDSGFYTEVHHIDGEGEDAGVVYAEMQACENTGSDKTYHAMMESLYKGSGYACNTGGKLENLRSLSVEKVREYHKKYYRPDNVCVVITGKVTPEQVIDAVLPIEQKIIAKNLQYSKVKPWSTPIPPVTTSVEQLCEFPADEDEGGGIVFISWRGTNWRDVFYKNALTVLWTYLSESAVAPLEKQFIDIPDPLAGKVSFGILDNAEFGHYVHFSNVPSEKIDLIKNKFFEVVNEQLKTGIDMKRMDTVIKNRRVKHLSEYEEDPHRTFAMCFIGDFLYGQEKEDLYKCVALEDVFTELETKPASYWLELLQKSIIEQPHVCIVGKPSVELSDQLQDEEDNRIDNQCEELGDERLDELEKELEEAQEKNNVPVSDEILKKFAIPNVESIPFIPVVSYRSDTTPTEQNLALFNHLESDSKQLFPFLIHFDHIPSAFIDMYAVLDTSYLTETLRPYIELFLDTIFETPIYKQGTLIPYEQVVQHLDEETVDHSNYCGLGGGGNFSCGSFAQLMGLQIKVEAHKYSKGIEILHDTLWNTRFTAERLQVAANKLINDVARVKRSAKNVTRSITKYQNFDSAKSNHNATNMVKQFQFLNQIKEQLEKDPNAVIAKMNEFSDQLCKLGQLRIHVVGNILKQQQPKTPWLQIFAQNTQVTSTVVPKDFNPSHTLLKSQVFSPKVSKASVMLGIGSTDSSYLTQTCPSITNANDPDKSALMVLMEYLTALEGPFWKMIRGKGLSYSFTMYLSVDEGLLYFVLSQSASLVKAYAEAQRIVQEYLDEKIAFDETALEAARSSVIFEVIANEETMHNAADLQFQLYLEKSPSNANVKLLQQVANITIADLKRVMHKYLAPLFDKSKVHTAIVTNPSKMDEIEQEFADLCKRKLVLLDTVEDAFE